MSTEMKPTVGRIVHYTSYGTPGGEYSKQCRAAIVTEVPDDFSNDIDVMHEEGPTRSAIGLQVFNPTGTFIHPVAGENPITYDPADEPKGGTWHWPERS